MHYFGVDDKIRAGNILQTGGKGMLKKIMFLCLSLFFLMGVASAQQFSEGKSTRNVLQTTGKIKQLNEIGVNLLGEGDFKEVVLKLDDKTHQMIRLLLIEQVYRAFKISKGEKYHW